jgi:hypothetical protein
VPRVVEEHAGVGAVDSRLVADRETHEAGR